MALTPDEISKLIEATGLAENQILSSEALGGVRAPSPGSIGYLPMPAPTPYSEVNLPEFMKTGYQKIGDVGYAPISSLLGGPVSVDKIQFSGLQDYAQRYADLQKEFEEAIAIRPEWFSRRYTPGQFIPAEPLPPVQEDTSIGDIAKVASIAAAYPSVESVVKSVADTISPALKSVEETVGYGFEEAVTDPIKKGIIDPIVETVSPAAKSIEETIGYGFEEAVTDPIKKGIIDPIVETYKESDLKQGIEDFGYQFEENVTAPIKENIIDPIAEWINSQFDSTDIGFGTNLPVKETVDTAKAVKDFIDDPHSGTGIDVVEAINKDVGKFFDVAEGEFFIDPAIGGAIADAGAIAGIANAIEDPSVSTVSKALDDIQYLADNFLDETIDIPGSDIAGSIGAMASGLEVLSDGVDSVSDAAKVAESANLVAGAVNNINAGASVGTAIKNAANAAPVNAGVMGSTVSILSGIEALEGGIDNPQEALAVASAISSAGSLLGSTAMQTASSVLGPIGVTLALADTLGAFDEGSTYGNAVIGRNESGVYSIESESSKNKGSLYTVPEAHAANLVLSELEKNYGFEFNEDAWKNVNTKIDYDSGQMKRSARDVVVDAIEKGALVPTQTTPKSIDWENIFADARKYTSEHTSTDWQAPYGLTGFKTAEQAAAGGADIIGAGMAGALADVGLGYTPMSDIMSNYDFSGINLDLSGIKI